tara:strand:- start:509 stop:1009 length:501 start_codon:yes stop_codon:yes gene_type:complete
MIQLTSKKTKDIDTFILNQILRLKNSHWTYGLNSQEAFFKKKIHSNDIHNLLLIKDKLIGYTCLRFIYYSKKSRKKFLYFDTLIIKKSYRGKGLSKILMNFNNMVIKLSKSPSHLVCKKKMINFYSKYLWEKSPQFLFSGINSYDQCLSYNYKSKNKFKNKITINL